MADDAATPDYTTRLMWPKRRLDLPEWEVMVGGRIVGWVRQVRIGRSSVVFFEATGMLDGERVRLEVTADRDERFRVVAEFSVAPQRYRRHLTNRQLRSISGQS
ncbi:hypothetical protein [Gryllotalpicola koreensis]